MDIKQTKPSLSQEANSSLNPKSGFSDSPPLMAQFTVRTMGSDLKNASLQSVTELTGSQTVSPPVAPGAAPLPKAENEKEVQKKQKQEAKAAKASAARAAKEAQKKLALEKKTAEEAAAAAAKEAVRATKEKLIKAKEAQDQKLRAILEQTKLKLAAKEFNAAMADAQKIMDSPAASWLATWRAKRLVNKIQKAIRQSDAEKINADLAKKMEKPAPAPIAPRPIISPVFATPVTPPNLPILKEVPAIEPTPPVAPLPISEPKSEITKLPPATPPITEIEIAQPASPSTKPIPAPFKMLADLTPDLLESKTAEPEKVLNMKKVALVGLASIAVLALIVGGWWYFLKQPQPPAQISQSPSPRPSLATQTPIPAPTPLFKTDSQKVFELKIGQEKANIQEAIAQMAQTDEPAGSFIYLLFKDSQGNFLSLDKIASSTEIDLFDLPTQVNAGSLKDQLDMNSFSFFSYSQGQPDPSPFASGTNSGRLGIIILIKNATLTVDLAKSLRDLEQLMLPGLKILLTDAKNNFPAKPIWLDNTYNNIAVRYINLPDPSFSLDYAILNNQLIFATSKESMYAIIDRVLPQIIP